MQRTLRVCKLATVLGAACLQSNLLLHAYTCSLRHRHVSHVHQIHSTTQTNNTDTTSSSYIVLQSMNSSNKNASHERHLKQAQLGYGLQSLRLLWQFVNNAHRPAGNPNMCKCCSSSEKLIHSHVNTALIKQHQRMGLVSKWPAYDWRTSVVGADEE